jgi:hypothetical protein
LALDDDVGHEARTTVVADKTSVRHCRVGESGDVVIVVVVVMVSEWVEQLIWLCVMV